MNADLVKLCPTCKAEYIPSVERCPSCGGVLVSAMVREEEDPYVSLTEEEGRPARLEEGEPAVVAKVSTLDEVTSFAVELAADGIAYRIERFEPPSEEGAESDGETVAPKPPAYRLLIHPRDVEHARAIYARYQREENPDLPPDLGEELTECPACFGPLVAIELGKRCPECDLEFHELPGD